MYFPVVLFITLYKVVLTLSLWMKSSRVTIQMQATEKYFLYVGVYFTANQIKVRRQYFLCVAVHVEQDGFTCLSRSSASKLSTCEIPLLYFLSTDSSSSSPSPTACAAICAKFSLSSVSSPGCCKKETRIINNWYHPPPPTPHGVRGGDV